MNTADRAGLLGDVVELAKWMATAGADHIDKVCQGGLEMLSRGFYVIFRKRYAY